jgi:hypothetical protein
VGQFHIGAHVKDCFWKYSLNFIVRNGSVDGEIMETLWSLFNKAAVMARTMSISQRWEFLDAHMRDINWKKMVGMGWFRPIVLSFV